MRGVWGFVAIAFLVGLAAIGLWRAAIGWHPSIEHYPVQGVDVSAGNGVLDWHAVAAAGADFGYAVATTGATRRDAAFERNWRDIAEAGMRRGAIHMFSFCQLVVDQANAFNTVVPRSDDALPAAIDVSFDESCTSRPDRKVVIDELARLATIVESHTGKPVLLRVARSVESDYRLTEALPRGIWSIGNAFPPDYAARPWRIWRASDFREIPGVDGPLNWNVVTR